MASTPPQRVRSPGLRLSGLVRAVLTVEKKDTEVAEAFFASSAHARHDETLSAGEADSAYQQVFHADASTSNTAATLAIPMAVTTVATTELCTVLKTDSGEARRTSLSVTDHGNVSACMHLDPVNQAAFVGWRGPNNIPVTVVMLFDAMIGPLLHF